MWMESCSRKEGDKMILINKLQEVLNKKQSHVLFLGDCRETLKTIPEKSIDCVITSPPYWLMREYEVEAENTNNTIGNEKKSMDYKVIRNSDGDRRNKV